MNPRHDLDKKTLLSFRPALDGIAVVGVDVGHGNGSPADEIMQTMKLGSLTHPSGSPVARSATASVLVWASASVLA